MPLEGIKPCAPIEAAVADKFWARVSRGDGCWLWTGAKFAKGYGAARFQGKQWIAHRLAFHLAFGGIPEGKHILHRCDNPPCCRPDHLYAGTPLDNARDRMFNPLPGRETLGMLEGSSGPVTSRLRNRGVMPGQWAVKFAQMDYGFYEACQRLEDRSPRPLPCTPDYLIDDDRRLQLREMRERCEKVFGRHNVPSCLWAGRLDDGCSGV